MFDMIGNIMRNLTSKPATRRYPFEKREAFKDSRGMVRGVGIDECIFCGICSKKCPSNAIVVNKQEKSWEIDPYKCVICGVCSEVCPKKCINMGEEYNASTLKKSKSKFVQETKPADEAKKNNEELS
jgi:ech hydrogenase subunit F